MNTEEMLESLENKDILSAEDASQLAKMALKEFGRFSKEAGKLEKAINSGCVYSIYGAVYDLFAKHKRQEA